jgi:hypothetical protein
MSTLAEDTLEALINPKEREKPAIDPQIIRMSEREGPLWSAEMDDRQLRRYLLESGMLEEKKRQEFLLENRYLDEVLLRFSLYPYRAVANVPTENMANSYALALGYEFHLLRVTRALDSFSASLFLENGVDYYDVGGFNARGLAWAFSGYFNWYFLSRPSAISGFMGNLGLGIRYGTTKLEARGMTTDYPYQIITLPGVKVGFKYRFPGTPKKDGAGWGFIFEGEYLRSQLNVLVNLKDNIYGTINAKEFRLNMGITFTF